MTWKDILDTAEKGIDFIQSGGTIAVELDPYLESANVWFGRPIQSRPQLNMGPLVAVGLIVAGTLVVASLLKG